MTGSIDALKVCVCVDRNPMRAALRGGVYYSSLVLPGLFLLLLQPWLWVFLVCSQLSFSSIVLGTWDHMTPVISMCFRGISSPLSILYQNVVPKPGAPRWKETAEDQAEHPAFLDSGLLSTGRKEAALSHTLAAGCAGSAGVGSTNTVTHVFLLVPSFSFIMHPPLSPSSSPRYHTSLLPYLLPPLSQSPISGLFVFSSLICWTECYSF